MRGRTRVAAGLAGALVLALAASVVLDRRAPAPSADVRLGSEDAFATGLAEREFGPEGFPRRWTSAGRARFALRNLEPGEATLEVRVRGQRGPVAVAASGVVVGSVAADRFRGRFAVTVPASGALDVELAPPPFRASDGRALGALVDRVGLEPAAPSGAPPWGVVGPLALGALVAAFVALASGWGVLGATLSGGGLAAAGALALAPSGLVRSPYAAEVGVRLALAALVAAALAWLWRSDADRRRWAFVAMLGAGALYGVAATHPTMIVSDLGFHVHNLLDVSRGDLWLTSRTQHDPPFEFPYGVSGYALLAPLARARLDPAHLVRDGAAVAALAGAAALFGLLAVARGGRFAALAVAILLALPGVFRLHSFGNLSNVFGQAATVAFLAWWAGRRRGGAPVGAVLFAGGALAHFSSLVVLLVLTPFLVAAERGGSPDRKGLGALAGGVGMALVYYVQFTPLVLRQLPRLLAGTAGGAGAPWAGRVGQLGHGLVDDWGVAVLLLALAGWRLAPRDRPELALRALWYAGGTLALLGLVSPLEVRYLYALTPALAASAAVGASWLWRQGVSGRVLAALALGAQIFLAGREVVEAVLIRYRA